MDVVEPLFADDAIDVPILIPDDESLIVDDEIRRIVVDQSKGDVLLGDHSIEMDLVDSSYGEQVRSRRVFARDIRPRFVLITPRNVVKQIQLFVSISLVFVLLMTINLVVWYRCFSYYDCEEQALSVHSPLVEGMSSKKAK